MKFLVYILIFSSYSQADYLISCNNVSEVKNLSKYFEEENKKHNLQLICKAAETKAENCCSNPKACPGWKDTTVNIINDLSQAAAMALGPTYQMSGDRMKACELGNMSSALGHTSSALSSIQTDKCAKASEKCSETCENKYKDFLVEFISFIITEDPIDNNNPLVCEKYESSPPPSVKSPAPILPPVYCITDKDVTFADLKKYINKPKKIKVDYFRNISKEIYKKCEAEINQSLTSISFDNRKIKKFEGYAKSFNPLEDCEDLTKNNELAEAGIQQLQLQLCQEVRAATQQNPINVRTPGTSSTDLTGTQFAFNQDEGGPGTT
ncbi:MAG: hypothetical protein ACR2M7_00690, partial [Bdellovibrionales bacterium]